MTANLVPPGSVQDPTDLTPRQGEVLDAALDLLVRTGSGFTMAGVAGAASCSKETLYNWFGDRKGLLEATVRRQASKVEMPRIDLAHLDRLALESGLERFGVSLLGVLSSPTSVALNRFAIGGAGEAGASLGHIVLQNGRFAMGRHLKPLFEAADAAGLVRVPDSEVAYQVYFGLLLRDTQIRLLLGEDLRLSKNDIWERARSARAHFMKIFGS